MSADFWAGYISGAAGILIGNPLDLVKTRLQAGKIAETSGTSTSTSTGTGNGTIASPYANTTPIPKSFRDHFDRTGTLVRGATAPILGYGALNALLFVTYNRSLSFLSPSPSIPPNSHASHPPTLPQIYLAGALGGLATFVVSAPTELIKCRAQVSMSAHERVTGTGAETGTGNSRGGGGMSSWRIAQDVWKKEGGVRGLYCGGGITAVRDAVGYGFYFLSYEHLKRTLTTPDETDQQAALKVLLCGGLAGIFTWTSVFPLDVIKTRVQTQEFLVSQSTSLQQGEQRALLLQSNQRRMGSRMSTFEVARQAYRNEGMGVFFRGLGICNVRAFVVNAVQWAVYEWMMSILQ